MVIQENNLIYTAYLHLSKSGLKEMVHVVCSLKTIPGYFTSFELFHRAEDIYNRHSSIVCPSRFVPTKPWLRLMSSILSGKY